MEILNILYNNNLIAVYLIGAILFVILIFIVISSINTTPKNKNKILEDPTEKNPQKSVKEEPIENNSIQINDIKEIDIPKENKINDMVNNIYNKVQKEENSETEHEAKDLNEVLQEFDVPESVIEDVVKEENSELKPEEIVPEIEEKELNIPFETSKTLENPEFVEEIETPKLKTEETSENIESMLKRLYNLRQNERENQKHALINEIIDLKKELDEAFKNKENNYELNHYNIDSKELADYYLFNKDIEFPKLK